ncbi:DNA cytosine methyltransferase [Pseudomonas syringae]|uniref:DNA cytosine methyltransferase n=1 Tax=Pseudomonas syringae TaxID=317 RepID=UPI0023F988D9|nr:DNA cytosine methyltransferase [Pseudomonas syringae]MDF7795715.1 DNA cytosine methyltransferase [Pseudomonas syringae]
MGDGQSDQAKCHSRRFCAKVGTEKSVRNAALTSLSIHNEVRRPKWAEFFAGGGMARAGFGNKWNCVFANDFDNIKVSCYANNWGTSDLVPGDIRSVPVQIIPDNLELAWASTPCQNFSSAGLGEGLLGKSSSVFICWWNLIRLKFETSTHPKIVVLENVRGLLKSRGGRDFREIAESFYNTGYRFGVIIIDAIHFLPQSRPRLFLVAIRNDFVIPGHLLAEYPNAIWHPEDLKSAINGLPAKVRDQHLWWSLPFNQTMSLKLCDLLEDDVDNWHSSTQTKKLLDAMSLINVRKIESVAASRSPTVGTLFRRMRPHEGGMRSFTEVRLDGIAGCLRASDGGSSRQMLIFINGDEIKTRHMTARESARLMGLPDSYVLPQAKTHAAKLVGDGVAVPVVQFLADSLLTPLVATQYVTQPVM